MSEGELRQAIAEALLIAISVDPRFDDPDARLGAIQSKLVRALESS